MNSVSLITICNFGYRTITSNMLASLKKINLLEKMTVYCLDNKTQDYLIGLYPQCNYETLVNTSSEELVDFRRKGWNHIVYYKMKAIYFSLKKNDRVLFIDGDIVLYNDPLKYLESELKDKDILFQTDIIISNELYHSYFETISKFKTADELVKYFNTCGYLKPEANTGFMYIKSCPKTISFFNYNNIDIETFGCDQIYINDRINNLNYGLLRVELFPTGLYIKSMYIKVLKSSDDIEKKHFIIHFNYTLASYNKIDTIKKMNSCYIDK